MVGILETGSTDLPLEQLDLRGEENTPSPEPAEELVEVRLREDDATRTVRVGSALPEPLRGDLTRFLRDNADVFAWTAKDMPGIPRHIAEHRLSMDPERKPVKQKKRKFAPDRQKAIEEEVGKLLKAGFIKEAHYPEWLANVVMVPKSNGKWRICIDFTDLNKACPKDPFPLPHVDQLIDATAGHQLLTFMDAYAGYNQIPMAEQDVPKTAFIMDRGLYCYRVMPFGLKNAGATYQRMVNKMFEGQIGRNMEVYVDDMLVKSTLAKHHIADLKETFDVLRGYGLKLNPSKCAFGVGAGKLLGFMVSNRGIEVNPEKIKAILDMSPPRNIKEVQRLNGRLAALGRFLSKSGEKSLPFFSLLRKASKFEWTGECQSAFETLKTYFMKPPLLSKPVAGEELFLYLAASEVAVSAVLIREEPGEKLQKPVYYVSKLL